MPTTSTNIYASGGLQPTFDPELARTQAVGLKPSTVFQDGCLIGEITASPGVYAPYAAGNGDGSQVPKFLLKYGGTTDANGLLTGMGEYGFTLQGICYVKGTFKLSDIPTTGAGARDAAGLAALTGATVTTQFVILN